MITTHNMHTGTQNLAGTAMDSVPATTAAVPHSSNPSNPLASPVITGDEGPTTKDTRTLEQRLAEIRDLAQKRWPKNSVTVRLDVTTAAPGMEFSVHCTAIPDTDPKTRYGVLKSPTVIGLKQLVEAV